MRLLLIGLVALAVGCDTRNNFDPDEWAQCEEGGQVFHTRTDPNHCGGCYVRCEADVPCDDWACQYNTTLHCGAPHRQCVAPDGQGVECVEAEDADGDLEVVGGYACQPSPQTLPEQRPPAIEPEEIPGMTLPFEPSPWVGIPGHSAQCQLGLDNRLCQQGDVEFTDICGRDVVQPLAYDFEIMTTEVSRGQYRAKMCGDCLPPQTLLCQGVCGDLYADDRDARDARPITGLNWCEAYTVCRELGGRLPTVQERARVEALAYGSRALFRQTTSCAAWAEQTGRSPWLAECFDDPPAMPGFDRVDGLAGHVLLGVGVLETPQAVHHLVGNVDEWLADPAEALTTGAVLDGPRWWSVAATEEERRRPRLVRGRSLVSPAGQSGDRMLLVEPQVRAADVGVRCARTTLSPYDEPVPYAYGRVADDHARCGDEPTGLRPVREMTGQQVFRATAICIDAPMRDAHRPALTGDLQKLLIDETVALGRLTHVDGELVGLGLARFAIDEQWWLGEPADPEDETALAVGDRLPDGLEWRGESSTIGDRCRHEMMASANSATDGHVQRLQNLVFARRDLRTIWLPGPDDLQSAACSAFECAYRVDDCAAECDAWVIPLAIAFERAEPFDRARICDASTANPAER